MSREGSVRDAQCLHGATRLRRRAHPGCHRCQGCREKGTDSPRPGRVVLLRQQRMPLATLVLLSMRRPTFASPMHRRRKPKTRTACGRTIDDRIGIDVDHAPRCTVAGGKGAVSVALVPALVCSPSQRRAPALEATPAVLSPVASCPGHGLDETSQRAGRTQAHSGVMLPSVTARGHTSAPSERRIEAHRGSRQARLAGTRHSRTSSLPLPGYATATLHSHDSRQPPLTPPTAAERLLRRFPPLAALHSAALGRQRARPESAPAQQCGSNLPFVVL
jgi:hypothetical protein